MARKMSSAPSFILLQNVHVNGTGKEAAEMKQNKDKNPENLPLDDASSYVSAKQRVEKTEEAKRLLRYTDKSLAAISAYLGSCVTQNRFDGNHDGCIS